MATGKSFRIGNVCTVIYFILVQKFNVNMKPLFKWKDFRLKMKKQKMKPVFVHKLFIHMCRILFHNAKMKKYPFQKFPFRTTLVIMSTNQQKTATLRVKKALK